MGGAAGAMSMPGMGMGMGMGSASRSVHTVVMVRHGESTWNVENRFTGWCDVPLTSDGEEDAVDAGRVMKKRGLQFDVAFTSNLERAWRTCALTLAAAGQSGAAETIRSSQLNERHYGALQGHRKDCPKLAAAFGQVGLVLLSLVSLVCVHIHILSLTNPSPPHTPPFPIGQVDGLAALLRGRTPIPLFRRVPEENGAERTFAGGVRVR
jgi:hypothetical protein